MSLSCLGPLAAALLLAACAGVEPSAVEPLATDEPTPRRPRQPGRPLPVEPNGIAIYSLFVAFDAGHLAPLDLLGNRHCNPRARPLTAGERDRVTKAVEAAERQWKEMREGARLTRTDELIACANSGAYQTVVVKERHIEAVRDQAKEQLKNKALPRRFLDDMQKRFDNPEIYAPYVAAEEVAQEMAKSGKSPMQISGVSPDGTPGWLVIAAEDLPGEALRRHGEEAIYALVTRTLAQVFHDIGTLTDAERDALHNLPFQRAKAERWAQILPGR